jgi:hypothetical protein
VSATTIECNTPDNPPSVNIAMKPNENSIAVVSFTAPP